MVALLLLQTSGVLHAQCKLLICTVSTPLISLFCGLNLPQALCVCPTRELVVQNQMVLERMGKFTGARHSLTAGSR